MTDRKGNSLSPEPCALIPTGLSFSSMTSGRGLPTTAAGTARVASASVMDGPFGSER